MSTVDVTDKIPHEDGERVLLLDDKNYVAVFVTVLRNKVHSEITVRTHIRAITEAGLPECDAHGQVLETYHTRSMFADGLTDFEGIQGLILDCVRIAVGDSDPQTLGEVNDNIRNVLTAADAVAEIHGEDSAEPDAAINWTYTEQEVAK